MNESIEKCKYCGRDLNYLEIYEKCPCQINKEYDNFPDDEDDDIISED